MQEKTYGINHRVMDVLFLLFKMAQPGSLEEQDNLHHQLVSPNPCREPSAALKELRRWLVAMNRAVDLEMAVPGLGQLAGST